MSQSQKEIKLSPYERQKLLKNIVGGPGLDSIQKIIESKKLRVTFLRPSPSRYISGPYLRQILIININKLAESLQYLGGHKTLEEISFTSTLFNMTDILNDFVEHSRTRALINNLYLSEQLSYEQEYIKEKLDKIIRACCDMLAHLQLLPLRTISFNEAFAPEVDHSGCPIRSPIILTHLLPNILSTISSLKSLTHIDLSYNHIGSADNANDSIIRTMFRILGSYQVSSRNTFTINLGHNNLGHCSNQTLIEALSSLPHHFRITGLHVGNKLNRTRLRAICKGLDKIGNARILDEETIAYLLPPRRQAASSSSEGGFILVTYRGKRRRSNHKRGGQLNRRKEVPGNHTDAPKATTSKNSSGFWNDRNRPSNNSSRRRGKARANSTQPHNRRRPRGAQLGDFIIDPSLREQQSRRPSSRS